MVKNDLFQNSIHIINTNQASSGAYPACPNFSNYRYCWFRDGAFIAYAMDTVGQHESAQRFHNWVIRTILSYEHQAERAIEKTKRGESLGDDFLHTRYKLDGTVGSESWPNFQLDGLGTWLWALDQHLQLSSADALQPDGIKAVELVTRYLTALWPHPCYDLWEEHPEYRHPYTLASIYAGLMTAEKLLNAPNLSILETANQLCACMLEHGVKRGHLIKQIDPRKIVSPIGRKASISSEIDTLSVDASLIGVSTPYQVLAPNDPIMRETIERIETDLHRRGGGVYRYLDDTYYGGGEWVLLAAWLGWHCVEIGEIHRACELLQWIEIQANDEGYLSEQVSTHLLSSDKYFSEWKSRWGPIANPLLWSHAMYLILRQALESKNHLSAH